MRRSAPLAALNEQAGRPAPPGLHPAGAAEAGGDDDLVARRAQLLDRLERDHGAPLAAPVLAAGALAIDRDDFPVGATAEPFDYEFVVGVEPGSEQVDQIGAGIRAGCREFLHDALRPVDGDGGDALRSANRRPASGCSLLLAARCGPAAGKPGPIAAAIASAPAAGGQTIRPVADAWEFER